MERLDNNKRKKVLRTVNFIEELTWFFSTNKVTDLNESLRILKTLIENGSSSIVPNKYESPNPNKNYLIGVLPNLFQDSELFRQNNDLSDFAESVLNISVNRSEKRSRYELIGLIVCEVIYLDESDLSNLVDALTKLTNNTDRLKEFKEAKKSANFSWNAAIQQLTSQ